MIRIGNSKEPTPKQMLNMVKNLRKKYNKAAKIYTNAWSFSTGDDELTYGLYLEHFQCSVGFESWPELLKEYRKLMKEEI